jgi:3'-phosphoadenosine 5'-phosphosulfate sulfotransferase (PAPS reductase)/FAD synthetase
MDLAGRDPGAGMTREMLARYRHVIVAFSGGKDSLASLLHLLDCNVPRQKIELWHHDVDGREGSRLMDWPVTRDYCAKVAAALGLSLFYSWKEGGFEREMARDQAPTAPVWFETPHGLRKAGGQSGNLGTRKLFPQKSGDLRVRWCSAYLKIDVGAIAIRNQARFDRCRTLVVSGERGEESPNRAKYKLLEPDRTDLARKPSGGSRWVDRWRPVKDWPEADVWDAIRRHGVVAHPAYHLGWGRLSCAACIFGDPAQWATLRAVNGPQFADVSSREQRSGKTIDRKLSVIQQADRGEQYEWSEADRRLALSETYDGPVLCDPAQWKLPRGAFKKSAGPT